MQIGALIVAAGMSSRMGQFKPMLNIRSISVAHGGIIAQFLQEITGVWYKPTYAEVIPLVFDNGCFCLQEK